MPLHGYTTPIARTKMDIRIKRKFAKQNEKAPKQVQQALDQRLIFFQQNPFHPLLNNHALTGKYKGFRSINISGDWRALYKEKGRKF